MKKSNGFTLVELVIVIIVLGILSATAVPKFMNIHSDARKATLDGFAGAFLSANTVVMSKAAIDGIKFSHDSQKLNDSDITVKSGNMDITVKNINNAMDIGEFNLTEAGFPVNNTVYVSVDGFQYNQEVVYGKKCYLEIKSEYANILGNKPDYFSITKVYEEC
ncbi:prepilin-type N-terminal cleavage/methylation domain-containing protein [Moritella sp. Urea-trap-13]|uniref:prepilin-type N-terminal cleavage/methylation domain-containing protein n=1 Tax=Moritella sp. Urea-trap-13 TaxID=2058327 RepID=UPI000C32B0B2|nr:prepilin-type N-terminal cleavage/methylation domain-containing protein [Moritella sp. Urea-trap-13]PKH06486.1 prepilin-type cleavage/methylation domain-containing protein [Moritella sp. Urea-trap-13]